MFIAAALPSTHLAHVGTLDLTPIRRAILGVTASVGIGVVADESTTDLDTLVTVGLLAMRAEVLKGHLDGLLLSMLEPGPIHGYAVIESLRARSNGAFDLPTGTVYPALHRLERAGLARGSWSTGPGRRRRVYELTAAGRAALSEQRVSWWQFAGAVSTVMGGGGDPAWTPAN